MLSFDVRIIMCHVIPILVSCDLQDPSPCAEFSVEEYVLIFTEVTNSEDIISAFNTSHLASNEGRVSLNITSGDGLQQGKIYNITMETTNSAGSSLSFLVLCESIYYYRSCQLSLM